MLTVPVVVAYLPTYRTGYAYVVGVVGMALVAWLCDHQRQSWSGVAPMMVGLLGMLLIASA